MDQSRRPCDPSCSSPACCPSDLSRRQFIQLAAAGLAAGSLAPGMAVAGPFDQADTAEHFIPADKKLAPEWVARLFAKGEATWYAGDDLDRIGMPIGGLCAGQLYLRGDGRLSEWAIFNKHWMSGYGLTSYDLDRRPGMPLAQGFAIEVQCQGETLRRTLDRQGFPGVAFCGEYPIGRVRYADPALPVTVTLEAFSPFIPLQAADSALPATVLEFTVKNTSDAPCEVKIAGWLENAVSLHSAEWGLSGVRSNELVSEKGVTMLIGSAAPAEPPAETREPIVLADFENGYGDWKVEGEAFGSAPAGGTLAAQQEVAGFEGKGLVNTFLGGDKARGKLTSPEFTIERKFINFLLGGGSHPGTAVRLLVDGQVVRSASGTDNERLQWQRWNVQDLAGKKARIEIVDAESGGWGHVNVDQIELRDRPRAAPAGALESQGDFGTMALALFDGGIVHASARLGDGDPAEAALVDPFLAAPRQFLPDAAGFDTPLVGAIAKAFSLGPGDQRTLIFAVAWHFPNRKEGTFYATRFKNAEDVARYIQKNYAQLAGDTRAWHAAWYDSTLPHWLLDRLFSTVSTLATNTCLWWSSGRFWAWEGVGCCHGTCAHVWNYEHAMARLFPELERSVRTMQDYGAGYVEETGMVRFRGEGWEMWAGDGQAGTVLKAYREHQMAPDDAFLREFWPRIRKSLEFLMKEDGNEDGLLEGKQHNTYDIDFYGPNTMVGSLYLGALRAGEAMAREMGDLEFAARCGRIAQSGGKLSAEQLFDGEYFVQKVDLEKHPKFQYAGGCLADQLFGQGWSHQVGLGYLYDPASVRKALEAIWRYDWAPDVGPQNEGFAPERWFARPGEAGLFTCTWPKGGRPEEPVRYRDEIWTGIEYQVAGHMVWEGMLTEALAICRGIHERYHPSKHNPWNEVECGDHYARGMASYGVFLALCGWENHGPKRHLGFSPKITPEDFRAAFTAAEAWGTIAQRREGAVQTDTVEVRRGRLPLKTLAFTLPDGKKLAGCTVTLGGKPIDVTAQDEAGRVTVTLPDDLEVAVSEKLEVRLEVS